MGRSPKTRTPGPKAGCYPDENIAKLLLFVNTQVWSAATDWESFEEISSRNSAFTFQPIAANLIADTAMVLSGGCVSSEEREQ
jgi:hypothetical protein